MSITYTAYYPRLPLELMDNIVDCGSDDRAFLKLCTHTARPLRARANKYIFHTVDARFCSPLTDILKLVYRSAALGMPIAGAIRTIRITPLQLAEADSRVFALVRSISSPGPARGPITLCVRPIDLLVDDKRWRACTVPAPVLRAALKYVTVLDLRGVPSFPSLIISACANLRELRLRDSSIDFEQPVEETPGGGRIRMQKLELRAAHVGDMQCLGDMADLRGVKRLRYEVDFDCCSDQADKIKDLQYVLDASEDSLEELCISSYPLPYSVPIQLFPDMSRLSSLRRLTFSSSDSLLPECEFHAPTGAAFLCHALHAIGAPPNALEQITILIHADIDDLGIVYSHRRRFEYGAERAGQLMLQQPAWKGVDRALSKVSHGRALQVEIRTVGTLRSAWDLQGQELESAIGEFEGRMTRWMYDALPLVTQAAHVRLSCVAVWPGEDEENLCDERQKEGGKLAEIYELLKAI